MLVVAIKGGLGNQMYQYGLYKKLISLGKKPILDIWSFNKRKNSIADLRNYELERIFNIKADYTNKFQSMLIKFFADRHNPLFRRYSDFYTAGDFDPKILNVECGFIDGYWQSFKYFSGIEDNLREDFKIKLNFSDKAKQLLNEIKNCNSVSISVRRGDFVKLGWETSPKYYDNAIKYISNLIHDVKFFCVSE